MHAPWPTVAIAAGHRACNGLHRYDRQGTQLAHILCKQITLYARTHSRMHAHRNTAPNRAGVFRQQLEGLSNVHDHQRPIRRAVPRALFVYVDCLLKGLQRLLPA